jgi:hypothetical protein
MKVTIVIEEERYKWKIGDRKIPFPTLDGWI